MKHADIVNKMSLEQKAAFVSGFDYWHLEEAPELGLPKIMVTDGPHGLRKQNLTATPWVWVTLIRLPASPPLLLPVALGTRSCCAKRARRWVRSACRKKFL